MNEANKKKPDLSSEFKILQQNSHFFLFFFYLKHKHKEP